jgi:endonuclease G
LVGVGAYKSRIFLAYPLLLPIKLPLTAYYIIAGGVGKKATLKGKVTVPEKTWKVIAVLEQGQGESGVSANTRLIAVMMPNSDQVARTNWTDYLVSVDKVEVAAHYTSRSNSNDSSSSIHC